MSAVENPALTAKPGQPFNERALLILLATIQFTAVVDFLIVMPLGPQYMRVFGISPGQFGVIVSSYAISAGISGIVMSLALDRFDRKAALLFLYGGFTLGTFCCALAPTYKLLVAARAATGAFGGITGALLMAIIGDVIPESRRGAAMGMVMSSFSVASICGVPIGLFLAGRFNWHVPFLVLAGLCVPIFAAAMRIVPHLRGHLEHAREQHPVANTVRIFLEPNHQTAFLFMAALTFTGFIIFPYLSNYMVANVGLTENQLPLIYLAGGAFTFFTLNLIGRWSDRAGKLRVFTLVSLMALGPILGLTHLPRVPLPAALAVSTIFMVCMSGRGVPAMAMMTSSIEPRYRGGFMSINSSVQQFACGVASYVSGQIMGQNARGEITHFQMIGWLSASFAVVCIFLARFLRRPPAEMVPGPVAILEG